MTASPFFKLTSGLVFKSNRQLGPNDCSLALAVSFWSCIVFGATQAIAASKADSMQAQTSQSKHDSLWRTAMVIDDADRRTEEQYAVEHSITSDEISRKFGGVGTLNCGQPLSASAFLVYKSNVIVSAAHVFVKNYNQSVNGKDCHFWPFPCHFTAKIFGKTFETSVMQAPVTGACGQDRNVLAEDDWAVARLSPPMPSRVEPFTIDEGDPVHVGERVIAVNGSNLDFFSRSRKTGYRVPLKSIGDCNVRKIDGAASDPIYFHTDCDVSEGSSGSAVVRLRDGHYEVIGIRVGGSEPHEMLFNALKQPDKSFIPNSGAFHVDEWRSSEVAIRREVAKAIRELGDFGGR
jgi:Trypsin-like peptidase domain